MIGAAGIKDYHKLNRHYINKRVELNGMKTYAEIHPYIDNGSMLENSTAIPNQYREVLYNSKETSF